MSNDYMNTKELPCNRCKKNPENGFGGTCDKVGMCNPGLRYIPSFGFNTLDTKRTRSDYHTFKPHANYKEVLKPPKGYVFSYFDISQLESRTIAYFSRDPNYMGSYVEGKDLYIEAVRNAHPDFTPKQLKDYRPYGKVTILSSWYGSSPEATAETHSLQLDEVKTIMNGILNGWPIGAQMRDHKREYCTTTGGMIETFIGDRLDGDVTSAYTISLNYANQNSASNLAVEGFMNAVKVSREYSVEIQPVSVIHDSCQNLNPIKDLFECILFYNKDFRGHCLAKYGVDLKIAIIFMMDQANDIEMTCKMPGNPEDYFWNPSEMKFTGEDYMEVTLEGYGECLTPLLDQILQYRKVEIIEDNIEDMEDTSFDDFLWETSARPHKWVDMPSIKKTKWRKTVIRVLDLDQKILDHYKSPIYIPLMYLNKKQLEEYNRTKVLPVADMYPGNHPYGNNGERCGYYWQKVCPWDEHIYDPDNNTWYCKDPDKVFPAEHFINRMKYSY